MRALAGLESMLRGPGDNGRQLSKYLTDVTAGTGGEVAAEFPNKIGWVTLLAFRHFEAHV